MFSLPILCRRRQSHDRLIHLLAKHYMTVSKMYNLIKSIQKKEIFLRLITEKIVDFSSHFLLREPIDSISIPKDLY